MSFLFNEIDFNKALKETSRNLRTKKRNLKKTSGEIGKPRFILAKPKKGEAQLTITARMTKSDCSFRIINSKDVFKTYSEIPTDNDQEIKKVPNGDNGG